MNKINNEETYELTMWGCLYAVLQDYNVDVSHISGRLGEHIVEDFMELLKYCGYIERLEADD